MRIAEQPGDHLEDDLLMLYSRAASGGTDRGALPTMTIHPAGSALDELPAGHVIAKEESIVVLSSAAKRVRDFNL
ncbi:hypothetical protein ACWDZ6_20355 [Streptomyces sp. NPDC002926]